ncbi:uncharacterized protein LOC135463025 [Liolophura sinensis]|uniref:uncharacterized protein LOC135463025 n=1 Tax=Liolophura sinensis TaxID=3198878 RepID=UPI00315841E5
MFNFDHCEDVHIGDKSVKNITMERRAEELDNLREISLSKGKRWTKNTHLFQKTHSCEEALKTLKDNGVVVVVGRKGDGKTSIAKTILLQLKKEVEERSDSGNDVILVEVEEPGELVNFFSRNYDGTFLVLVDDVFGKSAVDGIKLDKWQRKAEDVWEALNDSNDIKLVMTLRKHVWNKAKPLLQDYDLFSNRIDLTCAEMSLGSEEKASILRAHVENSERIISDVLVREVSQTIPTPPGFPQCCSMFSTVESLFSQGAQFFRKPSKYLDKLLEELHSSNPNLYLPLALTLMFGGRFSTKNFSKDYLDKNPQVKKTVEEVLECCSTEGKVTLGQLKSSFDTLLDVFFESNENETSFRFNHDSIQEAVACHFGAKYPQVLIKCCRLLSLQQWICTRREDQESYVVYVKQNCFPDLCNRLNADLLEGKANTVFTLLPARDEIFVKGWIKGLENSASLVKKLEVHSSELLIHASKNGVRKFVEFVLSRSWAAPGAEVLAEAVKCAACGGHQDVLEILLDQNPPRIVVTEAFEEVLEVGHVSSARCLLQYYPELLQKQFPDKLDSLQRKQPAKRQNSQRWKKCLHLASYHGCVELVQHFLDRGMDPYVTDSLWKTALHHAAESGYANVVHLLIQIEGDLDKKDKFERTALHYAANEGHVDVVQQLVEAGASVNIVDQNGNTAKCLAESKGFEAVAELLGS